MSARQIYILLYKKLLLVLCAQVVVTSNIPEKDFKTINPFKDLSGLELQAENFDPNCIMEISSENEETTSKTYSPADCKILTLRTEKGWSGNFLKVYQYQYGSYTALRFNRVIGFVTDLNHKAVGWNGDGVDVTLKTLENGANELIASAKVDSHLFHIRGNTKDKRYKTNLNYLHKIQTGLVGTADQETTAIISVNVYIEHELMKKIVTSYFQDANDAFERSGVLVQLYPRKMEYYPFTKNLTIVDAMTNFTQYLQAEERIKHADLHVLFIMGPDIQVQAGQTQTVGQAWTDKGIGVCYLNNYTFIHELGHLLGAGHDPDTEANQLATFIPEFPVNVLIDDNNRGALLFENKRTLMAYEQEGFQDEIPYFSNPDIVDETGMPLGDRYHNNAGKMNANRFQVQDNCEEEHLMIELYFYKACVTFQKLCDWAEQLVIYLVLLLLIFVALIFCPLVAIWNYALLYRLWQHGFCITLELAIVLSGTIFRERQKQE